MANKIFIASDHAGFSLKKVIIDYLDINSLSEIVDLGTDSGTKSVDYPDYANALTRKINKNSSDIGILICGSGIGISIAANRKKHIRAALCTSVEMAKLSRVHNDANVLCLGARITDNDEAIEIINSFLESVFSKGRHAARVEKLSN